ncbi:MAG TPA: PQQ-binding-like beta-propeller repeat protein [Gemmatimonadales bacterium]|nr:PQQ-binding-like beta-propeller repeat protein [Gemmatimonadales bacterium]
MATAQIDQPIRKKPLRLWPGVIAALLLCVLRFVIPIFLSESAMLGVLGGLACGLAILVWWLFFSRAPWSERLGAIVLMVVGVLATSRIVHESIANGMMGMMLPIFAIPVLSLALVAWAVASRRLASGPRRASMVAAIGLACGVFTLLRTGGITGEGGSDLHWRWSQTPEQRLLAQAGNEKEPEALPAPPVTAPAETRPPTQASNQPTAPSPAPATTKTLEKRGPDSPVAKTDADWSGFRGPSRDATVRGVQIETDWSQKPPVPLWRRPIGPGWSSFAVHGNLFYTQEQRGDDEMVACYQLTTGKPVWRHRDPARFWESNAGAGPRATPTLSKGRVYTFGATGILNALDARDGSVVWSRNAASDASAKLPGWGFASSPLVVDDIVIVAASGHLAAYDAVTGNPRWFGPNRGGSYSSPHLMTIGGVAQVLLLSSAGVTSVAPGDGSLLWQHEWPGVTILQPARTVDSDVLITTGDMSGGVGMRRVAVARGAGGWSVEERWTSKDLKPYFNDFVVHKGCAFGFDGSILACIDLEGGKRKWKGGRYGHGQFVLLPDQDLLLVVSEEGELALVRAMPDQFTELARFKAIEGKTWNHPVLVGDVLLVRNGEEMAAFRLALATR